MWLNTDRLQSIVPAVLFVFTLLAPLRAGEPDDPQPLKLTEDRFEQYRDHIRPTERELKFMEVGWRPTFWQAVEEAREKNKPILLWAMNGHPLGHT